MRKDRGTAAVEMAIALVVLLLIVLGTYEYGTAFVDRNAMANATREGARAGTAAGDFDPAGPDNDADCVVIEAAAGGLQGMDGNSVKELWIYQSDVSGTVSGTRQVYRPPVGSETVHLNCGGSAWHRAIAAWPPSARPLGSNQWLGVKLIVDHAWKTGFAIWSGTTTWEEDVVMRLEPAAG